MGRLTIISFLLFSVGAFSQSTAPAAVNIIPQPGSPAVLAAARRGDAPRVMLRNRSGKTVIAYRLGWLDVLGKVHVGERTLLRVARGGTGPVKSRAFVTYPDARFFIAEIAFGNGATWKANLEALRNEGSKQAIVRVPV